MAGLVVVSILYSSLHRCTSGGPPTPGLERLGARWVLCLRRWLAHGACPGGSCQSGPRWYPCGCGARTRGPTSGKNDKGRRWGGHFYVPFVFPFGQVMPAAWAGLLRTRMVAEQRPSAGPPTRGGSVETKAQASAAAPLVEAGPAVCAEALLVTAVCHAVCEPVCGPGPAGHIPAVPAVRTRLHRPYHNGDPCSPTGCPGLASPGLCVPAHAGVALTGPVAVCLQVAIREGQPLGEEETVASHPAPDRHTACHRAGSGEHRAVTGTGSLEACWTGNGVLDRQRPAGPAALAGLAPRAELAPPQAPRAEPATDCARYTTAGGQGWTGRKLDNRRWQTRAPGPTGDCSRGTGKGSSAALLAPFPNYP